jgi:phage terminase large subunit-like protein
VRRAVLSIARKNGKTALIACLALVHLVGPEAIQNGEIYSAATEREQAGVVFRYAAQIVRADPDLQRLLKVVDSTKTIACFGNGSFYRAISAEAGSKHGLNPSLVIYDELAQARNRDLYDVLDTSMGARAEPLMVVISTQSNDPLHILSELIDDGLNANDEASVVQLHAVPDDWEGDLENEEMWKMANPALGTFRNIDDVRALARRAKRMPSFENNFRNLYLNQRVDAKSPLLAPADWRACTDEKTLELGERIFMGLDLSATIDLTALVAVSETGGDRVAAWFWKPEAYLSDHQKRDNAPYEVWAKQGWLEAVPGRSINYEYVANRIAEIREDYEIIGIAFDRWRIDTLVQACEAIGLDVWVEGTDNEMAGAIRLVPFGQGFKDMAPAVDAIEASVVEGTFRHPGNPVLTFCFSNAVVASDPAGNRKLDKSKTRFRIDGAVATAMAMGLKGKNLGDDGPKEISYERGQLFG